MRLFKTLSKVAAALIVVCDLMVISCEQLEASDSVFEVSVKKSTVDASKGQQFVSVRCTGDWTLALLSDEGDVGWASLDVNAGSGNKTNVKLSYETNATAGSRELRIVLDNGKAWTGCSMVQLAYGQEQNPTPEPEPMPDVDLAKMGWLELPAMNDPNLQYFSFSFQMGGQRYRNYSAGYSRKDYLALWVAYPLCSKYTNGSGGSSSWIENPLVDDNYEPNYANSFGYSQGYERGHQIANADRKCSSEANQQTYYFTNATLQHKDFNGHIWATLEGNLRSAANSADTVYVVTGCVLSDSPKTITDRSGHAVPVPSGYFKAAVRYSKSSTLGTWLGAAFYLDHKTYPYKNITTAESMSIDELEEKVGMDFFVNLPDRIGKEQADAIEAQNPDNYSSVWSIN